jgi:hypothetical protein
MGKFSMSIVIKIEDERNIRKRILELKPFKNNSMREEEALSMHVLYLSTLLCPIPKLNLSNQLNWSLGALFSKEEINEALEKHLSHQNLILNPSNSSKEIFTCPLRYIIPGSDKNKYILVGVGSKNQGLGNFELQDKLKFKNHIRYWNASDFKNSNELEKLLKDLYIQPVSVESWIGTDDYIEKIYKDGARKLIETIDKKLKLEGNESEGFYNQEYLDSNTNQKYYKGRWKEIKNSNNSACIIRFENNYAPVYRYAKIESRKKIKSIDLKYLFYGNKLKDEWSVALMIQQAIDINNHKPQIFKKEKIDESYIEIKFYHPIPLWLERYMDAYGEVIKREEGQHHLFSYKTNANMLVSIEEYLKEYWIESE